MTNHPSHPLVLVSRIVPAAFTIASWGLLLLALGLAPPSFASPAAPDAARFDDVARLDAFRADWVTADQGRLVFGSGTRLVLAADAAQPVFQARLELTFQVSEAVLFQDRLYVNRGGADLAVLDLEDAALEPVTVELAPAPRRRLHLSRAGDYFLVAEDGLGVRVLLPASRHHAGGHAAADDLREVGFLELEQSFDAIAGDASKVYLAVADRGIAVVDLSDPARPSLDGYLGGQMRPSAIAVNGPRLYVLGGDGLRTIELPGGTGLAGAELHPEVRGTALLPAGRTVHVAAGDQGLVTFRDRAAGAQIHDVIVTSNVFTPAILTIDLGDTVRWTNQAGFHNVESCDGVSDPAECGGQVAAQGAFTSGPAAFPPWNFSKAFTVAGTNRYFCVVHVFLGMVGSVNVNAPAPPGVPDGSGPGTPLTVQKLDAAGSTLRVFWDTSTCVGATNHQIVFGGNSQLPGDVSGIYSLAGSRCGIGTSSPFSWSGTPNPAQGTFLWFLVLANDGATREGSWGQNSGPLERTGPGPGGSSARCGVTTKDLTNACGQ